ncbi:MAG: LicD family protein [Oscillospiraceae bacterium]|nr:LicD family protein [Oscillospiraceae bacterium]
MSKYLICGYDIEDVQSVMLDIALEIDRICVKHDINYILDGGSMLGAVRHSGFIPWDDDLDIAMLREDYDRFVAVCQDELDEKFFLQTNISELEYPTDFAKMKRNNTVYVERDLARYNIHHGVYVDVFPIDNIKMRTYKCQGKLLSFIRNARWNKLKFPHGTLKKIVVWPLSLLNIRRINRLAEKVMRFYNKKPTEYTYKVCHPTKTRPAYKREIYTELIRVDFCGHKLCIPKDYEIFLHEMYGDYMKLPPKDKQKPAHHIIRCKLEDDYGKV